jgi:cytochrome b561
MPVFARTIGGLWLLKRPTSVRISFAGGAEGSADDGVVMYIRDTSEGYGIVSRLFHWLMAIAIFFMFGLGLWMVRLDYYSPYYNAAPELHRSLGIILLLALLVRWIWRIANPKPVFDDLTPLEQKASRAVHWSFYVLLLALMVSGYLIVTPDGQPVDVFGWFSVPSVLQMRGLEDRAGYVHRLLAYAVIALAVVHSLAALKHHFFDKSKIMTRMWAGPPSSNVLTSEKEDHL